MKLSPAGQDKLAEDCITERRPDRKKSAGADHTELSTSMTLIKAHSLITSRVTRCVRAGGGEVNSQHFERRAVLEMVKWNVKRSSDALKVSKKHRDAANPKKMDGARRKGAR